MKHGTASAHFASKKRAKSDKGHKIFRKMQTNRLNLRNVIVIAICLTGFAVFSGCGKEENKQNFIGKWTIVNRYGVTLEITKNEIKQLPVVPNPTPMDTRTYKWVSNVTIEINQLGFGGEFSTRNKVVFHTSDKVTIEKWFSHNGALDEPIYENITIERIAE